MKSILIKVNLDCSGLLCKMKCYINNNEICRLKNRETFFYETTEENVKFFCQETLGGKKSDIYELNFSNGNSIVINAVARIVGKPKVEINYEDNINQDSLKQKVKQEFNITKQVGDYLYIDEERKQWAVTKGLIKKKIDNVYKYSDITSFELIEDDDVVTKGGFGAAIIGDVLFGSTGAIIGGLNSQKKSKRDCTKLQIKITVNSMDKPVEYINIISSKIKRESILYKSAYNDAQKIISLLEIMYNQTSKKESAEDLKKYNELLEMGIITQEEFDKKKEQILNL